VNCTKQKVATEKVYITVMADCLKDGTVIPRSFVWEDGLRYHIQRVINMQILTALKSYDKCTRYKVLMRNQERYIFFEEYNGVRRWYVEREIKCQGIMENEIEL